MSFLDLDSPFYPGVLVSSDDFIGRKEELEEFTKSVSRVVNGRRIQGVLITGEKGVGKSSFSKYLSRYFASDRLRRMKKSLSVLSVDIRSCHDFVSFISAVHFTLFEKMREREDSIWKKLSKKLYGGMERINGVSVLDVGVNFTREERRRLFSEENLFEKSLRAYTKMIVKEGHGGLMLILDNVNDVVEDKRFPNYLKGFADNSEEAGTPILFVINAIPETWDKIHHKQPSVSRSYARIELQELEDDVIKDYFEKTFNASDVRLTKNNLEILTYASGGLPLSMQFVGDSVYWECEGGRREVDDRVIRQGVINGVKDIGIRYLNAQIFSAIRSDQYRSIISNDEFLQHTGIIKRSDIRKIIDKTKFKRGNTRLSYLDTNEAENLTGNFLTKMCNVGVLVKLRDEPAWRFRNRFMQVYLTISRLIPVSERTRIRARSQS